MKDPTPDLLQGLEELLEVNRRLAQVLRFMLEHQQRGQQMADEDVEQYLQDLGKADAERERMQQAVRRFWAMLGKEQAHCSGASP